MDARGFIAVTAYTNPEKTIAAPENTEGLKTEAPENMEELKIEKEKVFLNFFSAAALHFLSALHSSSYQSERTLQMYHENNLIHESFTCRHKKKTLIS